METQLHSILSDPALLPTVSDETLQEWITQYPYVPLFRLEKYKRTRTYDNALQTSFRIHNREILYQLLYGKENAVPAIKEETIVESVTPVTETKEIVSEIPIEKIKVEEVPILPVHTEPKAIDIETGWEKEEAVEKKHHEEIIIVETPKTESIIDVEHKTEKHTIADDVLETIRKLKEERLHPLPIETEEEKTGIQEGPITEPEIIKEEVVVKQQPVVETQEEEIIIPVPEIKTPEEIYDSENEIIVVDNKAVWPGVEEMGNTTKDEPENMFIPEVEEDLIEEHQESEIISEKESVIESPLLKEPVANIMKEEVKTEPVVEINEEEKVALKEPKKNDIYLPPIQEEVRAKTEEPEPIETVQPPVSTDKPHSIMEWISLLDGGIQIEKPFDTQPKEDWIEVPRFEIEFQQEHKNVYTVEDFEGELDSEQDIDADLNRLAGESVEFKQDMMTETLAQIYVKQGKPDKALLIYNTLRLKFPEKSAYFVAIIQKIERGE